MIEDLLFPALLALSLLAVLVVLELRRRSRRGRKTTGRKADPATVARLREQIHGLDLRGQIVATTTEAGVPGLILTRLGQVQLTRDAGYDATNALARAAADRYPDGRVLTRIMQHTVKNRVEWRAIVSAAQPDNPGHMPALPEGQPFALVDGSNVVNWERNAGLIEVAKLQTLLGVLDLLRSEGMGALVVFDNSVGYHLHGKYMTEVELTRALGNRRDVRVDLVPKGTVADRHLIALALESGAEIVTNDLFRDHSDAFFLTKRRGFSVGGYVELLPPRAIEEAAKMAAE
jgi:Zc3h12a-like Ribonuclease NYN domain